MHNILQQIKTQGVLPLYYHPDPVVCADVLVALYDAGIRVVEFTNRGPEALSNFSRLLALRDASLPGLLLGIGTIKTADQARAYIAAGADFLISPGVVPEVGAVAAAAGKFWVPGCMTPTEVIVAEGLGATFVKLFPGNLLTHAFVSAIRDLFPEMAFMPTGGAEPERGNLEAWFKAGVIGVGMGSKLISPSVLASKDYGKITEETRRVLALVREIRGGK